MGLEPAIYQWNNTAASNLFDLTKTLHSASANRNEVEIQHVF